MATEIPVANLYYLLCYAWGHAREREAVSLAGAGHLERVQDLLGTVLARGTVRLVKRGIARDYVEVRADLRGIRGKIDPSEMAKRALRSRGLAACQYEELSIDVLHNRILRSTLDRLGRLPARAKASSSSATGDLDAKVRREVRAASKKLAGVRLLRLDRGLFGQVQVHRNQRMYRFLLSVCRLVHEQLVINEHSGVHRFVKLDAKKMHGLFEDFVIAFFRREQRRFRVNHQGRGIRFVDAGTREDQRRWIPGMEADMILESNARRVIVDTKLYPEPLSGWHGSRKLRSAHLYQLLAYLRNRSAAQPGQPPYEGMLLYPQVEAELKIDVRLEGFDIRARTINLAQDWRDIHRSMIALLDRDSAQPRPRADPPR